MLKPGRAHQLLVCIQSPVSWPLPRSFSTRWAPLRGLATEPSPCIPATRRRRFPEQCSWVRYVTACFAPGQFYLKRACTLSVQGS